MGSSCFDNYSPKLKRVIQDTGVYGGSTFAYADKLPQLIKSTLGFGWLALAWLGWLALAWLGWLALAWLVGFGLAWLVGFGLAWLVGLAGWLWLGLAGWLWFGLASAQWAWGLGTWAHGPGPRGPNAPTNPK